MCLNELQWVGGESLELGEKGGLVCVWAVRSCAPVSCTEAEEGCEMCQVLTRRPLAA